MQPTQSQYIMRIDSDIFFKLKQISKIESRSINKQLEFIIKDYICSYEKNNGAIILEEE